MPEVPDDAVQAAAVALQAIIDPAGMREMDVYRAHARKILEAAAPALAGRASRAILAHMEAHGPKEDGTARRKWRRHFGIASRVAAVAFSAREEVLREAARVFAEGDYDACFTREDHHG